MMAKPMKTLELHYPIIQVLIIHDISLLLQRPSSAKFLDCEQSLFCSKILKRQSLNSEVARAAGTCVARARIRDTSSQTSPASKLSYLGERSEESLLAGYHNLA